MMIILRWNNLNVNAMYTEEVTAELKKFIDNSKIDTFLQRVDSFRQDPVVGDIMEDILDEWNKLQQAVKNGLMNEEQQFFAIQAYFQRRQQEFSARLNDEN